MAKNNSSIQKRIEKIYRQNHCGCVLCQLCNKKIYRTRKTLKPCCKLDTIEIQKQSDNLCEYLDKVVKFIDENKSDDNPKPIKLAIVGKDPYPADPMGIPFAKDDMSSQDVCDSGYVVLWALGIFHFPEKSDFAKQMFYALCNQGIVFLNVSYKYLGKGQKLTKTTHFPYLKCASSMNNLILEHTQSIFLCDSAKNAVKWTENGDSYLYESAIKKCHPSGEMAKDWKVVWATTPGCFQKLFQNKNEIKVSIERVNQEFPKNTKRILKPKTLAERKKGKGNKRKMV